MIKVLFLWNVQAQLQDYFQKQLADFQQFEFIFPSKKALDKKKFPSIKEVQIIVGWRPTEKLLKQAKKLQVFLNPGAGIQHLLPLFQAHGRHLKLCNCHGNAYFTAQHALALLLAMTNQLLPHHQWLKSGQWRTGDREAASLPLRYRHIGLLGYGAINQQVHQMLLPFGPSFSILKRTWNQNSNDGSNHNCPVKSQFTPKDLSPFLKSIDTLIVALPLTKKSKGMIGKKELKLLGKEGLLVNVGRGPIVKEKALYKALKKKKIKAAAIDVWYNYTPQANEKSEKFPWKYPFQTLDNLMLSPHRAASPMSDLKRWDPVIGNIQRFANQEALLDQVHLDWEY